GATGPPGLPGMISTFDPWYQQAYVYRGSWDYTISPRLLNRFYIGVNNWDEIHRAISNSVHWKDKVCVPNVPNCDEALTRVNHEFGTWGGYSGNGSFNPVRSFNDDLTYTIGKHSFKTGYMYDRSFYNGFGRQAIMGESWFGRMNTSIPLEPNGNIGGGSGFASFLLGEANRGSIETPRYVNMVYRYHAMYFQDDWRLTPRLTLNLGLRYEFTLPPINPRNELSDFDPARPNPAADGLPGALIFAGFGPGRENKRALIPGWYGAIGPRLGFSYGLDGKTVIRGSASRSFAPVKNTGSSTHFQGFIQMQNFPDNTNGLELVFKFEQGMPPWLAPPFIEPSFANESSPYYWQGKEALRASENLGISLDIQRQLTPSTLVEAGYSGMMGTHLVASLLAINQTDVRKLAPELSIYTQSGRNLLYSRNFNDPTLVRLGIRKPYRTFNDTVSRALKPFPQYQNIDTDRGGGDHSGHSTYHAMVVKLTRNLSHGLMVNASYVLS
ncbi:MAG: TonB-dependent receptor, partial [Acidobacteriota bacterium]